MSPCVLTKSLEGYKYVKCDLGHSSRHTSYDSEKVWPWITLDIQGRRTWQWSDFYGSNLNQEASGGEPGAWLVGVCGWNFSDTDLFICVPWGWALLGGSEMPGNGHPWTLFTHICCLPFLHISPGSSDCNWWHYPLKKEKNKKQYVQNGLGCVKRKKKLHTEFKSGRKDTKS